jgi:hypothetical protein
LKKKFFNFQKALISPKKISKITQK